MRGGAAMNVLALFDLAGHVALVTGASSGIGQAIAIALAGAGARIVLVARRSNELAAVREQIESNGTAATALVCDLADRTALDECARAAPAAFGAPDILVNAAGINLRQPMLEVTADQWDRTFAVNLDAPFFLAQRLAPAMIARGWGRIINVASLQSIRALPDGGAYGVTKGGIAQLTRAQAQAWSRSGVNANAIAPGFFATALTAPVANDPAQWELHAKRTFIGRNGKLDDLAGTAVYLASHAADYVTGQTIFVDGGYSAG
jgi:NAD(P)-dependent dehydrogenase (short-subunit alcohol dehydrogenase family)